jgi:eukaryotic-like serine/threonine-protein kinase
MPEIGQNLSHYSIVEIIGKGGMGEVYRAKDQKLGRDVAIKVLPEEFAKDADRVSRFKREAKLLASLNHPNIATIYGLEESKGTNFLVLELVEGDTLADQIKRGPIPVEESLKLALQIAEALEAAHERGVIHRDLKPANIKVTPDGKVKVLDFGLAKAYAGEQAEQYLSNSPTLTRSPTLSDAATQQGVILGTAAYMSPEQAKGKSVDRRTDIWAFGTVLFECLTATRAFQGETVTETLAAILKGEPDWNLLPKDASVKIRTVLQRCLQKDVKLRYHDISDVRLDIEAPETQPLETTGALWRSSRLLLASCVAVALLAGLLLGPALMKYFHPVSPAPMVNSIIKIEPGHWLGSRVMAVQRPSHIAIAISGNGSFVVYSAVEEKPSPQAKGQLYLRRLDQPEARPIAGTEDGRNPFLSPDGRWVGFWTDGKLKKVPVEGGVATALCDVTGFAYGASWSRDNRIVFADGYLTRHLSMVSAEGGRPEILTKPDPKRDEYRHCLPSWLPDGKAVLFTIMRHAVDSQPSVALLRLDTHDWRVLVSDAANARYVSPGYLVFLRQGTLMAMRFDPVRLELKGQPVALVNNVMQAFYPAAIVFHTGAGQFDISETGSLIYAAGGVLSDPQRSLVWVDQRGVEQPATSLQFPFAVPRLSPDGRKIAYAINESQVWVHDLDRGTNSRLNVERQANHPIWTPDGGRLLFQYQKSQLWNLFWQPYDGSSPMERLTTSDYAQFPGSFSSDGKKVVFVEWHEDAGGDLAVLEVSSGKVMAFASDPKFSEAQPDLSPNGQWIAYSSDESGRKEVYVRPLAGPGRKYQISNEGGEEPLWARNGKQLFYRRQDQVRVVDVQTNNGFATSRPRLLFEKSGYGGYVPVRCWDLSHDGQRFLMVKGDQNKSSPATEMVLIQNWLEELKQRVPSK